jgi:methionyl-tRNA formyltransferase
MRAVVLTNPQGNQNALVSKLARRVEIAAVVHSRNIPKKKPRMSKRYRALVNRIAVRVWGVELLNAWNEMLGRYEAEYERFRSAPVHTVDSVNDETTIRIVEESKPDIVIVSGTNIVGRRLIQLSKDHGGIVNLHTGISPYVKGGPNCTNWCLSKGWFHLIGNTVMWLDPGVDSGEIIGTERTPLDGSESLAELHWKVMEHAHDMYVNSIAWLGAGAPLPRVTQSEIGKGVEFKSADWTGKEARQAVRNFRNGYRRFFENERWNAEEIKLFPLDRGA